jgi:uncharacterized coiled-coil protein SlyX
MIKFFKNLFNLNKIVLEQQQTIIELKKLNNELRQLIDKFNQITIQ